MAERPVKNYNGDYITCYPGSNQHDEGKLNLEFNMARLVTRVSSKNFCTVEPSFQLRVIRGNTGYAQIEVSEGQCSINGRDIITTETIVIDAPEEAGDFYLALHLARDPHGNVYGDQVVGVTKTFMGVYLTYFDEKPEPVTDPDILYLGKLSYDGRNITSLEEDPDKYGRIWAEDILAKISDWKHPDTERLILQEWINKVPDWYVSKEGDVIFGALEFLPGRDPNVAGTIDDHEDLGTGKYGIRAEAIYDSTSNTRSTKIDIKAPDVLIDDVDKRLTLFTSRNGMEINLGQSVLRSDSTNDYGIDITTPKNIRLDSYGDVSLIGRDSISIGTGIGGEQPKLYLNDNRATFSSDDSIGLVDEVYFNASTLQHTIGKTILQYNDSNLSILNSNTDYVNVGPNTDFGKNIRVKDNIYLGNGNTYGSELSYLNATKLLLTNNNTSSDIRTGLAKFTNPTENDGYVSVVQNVSAYSTLYNSGKLLLHNGISNKNAQIVFENGTSGYNAEIVHSYGLNGDGSATVGTLIFNVGHSLYNGDITATGDIRANKVYNAVYNDVVEFMEKADYTEEIEAGDVVYFTLDGKVTKFNKNINPNAIAGVVSSEETYGYALGGAGLTDDQKVPVALKGRVWVKTDNIEFEPGDLLNVDSCGCVYRSQEYDRYTLGMATMPERDGKVYMLIK